MSSSESLLSKCITLLGRCTQTQKDNTNAAKTKSSDPISLLLDGFEYAVSQDEELKLHFGSEKHALITETASTSARIHMTEDVRIYYGRVICSIFDKVSDELNKCRSEGGDEYVLLSIQQISIISSAFQFFVLTAVLPYLEPGVGPPIQKRSSIIKTWKCLVDDVFFQLSQLNMASKCTLSLIKCNVALGGELIKRYLSDIICIIEQLKHLGGNVMDWDIILDDIPPSHMISDLISLNRCVDRSSPPPSWFMLAVGTRLSTILISSNGLLHTLNAYQEMGGDAFWQNYKLISSLGKQLAIPPRGHKKMAYYENIINQFFAVFKMRQFSDISLLQLLSVLSDELKDKLAGDVFILDRLFRCWELLMISYNKNVSWNDSMEVSLRVLSIWSDAKICPRLLLSSPRLPQLIPLFLDLFGCDILCDELKTLRCDLSRIIRFALSSVSNQSSLLVSYLTQQREFVYSIEMKKRMVVDLSEENHSNGIYGQVILNVIAMEQSEILARRCETLLVLFKEKGDWTSTLISIICECLEQWNIVETADEPPRFVQMDCHSIVDPEWRQLSSHMVAGFFFEQLGEWDIDGSDIKTILALIKLIQTVLQSARQKLQKEMEEKQMLDIKIEKDHKTKNILQQNVKLAVGLLGAIMMSASIHDETIASLSSLSSEVVEFCRVALLSDDEEMHRAAKDANEVLVLLKDGGITTSNNLNVNISEKSRGTVVKEDMMEALKKDLEDELEPIRGEALLRVGRLVRKKNSDVLKALPVWLNRKVHELLEDGDSYVFLAAINALSEIAVYDTVYLKEMIDTFKNFSAKLKSDSGDSAEKESSDSIIMLRGRMAEAMGKVFRQLGDVAPYWLLETAGILLSCLKEDEELIRASALSALADLVVTCRGRGLHVHLTEMLYATDQLIKTDKSSIVRRASVHLIREIIRSCQHEFIQILGDSLRDLRRSLVWLWKWDNDDIVRLHSQLAVEEMKAAMETIIKEQNNPLKQIRFV